MKNNKIFTYGLMASLLWLNISANAENPETSNSINVPEPIINSPNSNPVDSYDSKDLTKDTTNTTNHDPAKEIMPSNQEATQTNNNPNNVWPAGNNDPSSSMPMPENTKQELNADQNKENSTVTPTTLETKEKKESKFKSFFQKGDKSKK